jgi:hypothetical protein
LSRELGARTKSGVSVAKFVVSEEAGGVKEAAIREGVSVTGCFESSGTPVGLTSAFEVTGVASNLMKVSMTRLTSVVLLPWALFPK